MPRETPRLEQRIRANYAEERKLTSMLLYEDSEDTEKMKAALENLPNQPFPSNVNAEQLLTGLDRVNERVEKILIEN